MFPLLLREFKLSMPRAFIAEAGVSKIMFADESSIHSIRVGKSEGRFSLANDLISSVVRSSTPQM